VTDQGNHLMFQRTLVLLLAVAAAALAATPAALGAGGLALTPAVVEHAAKPGAVGTITVDNSSATALKVTVTPRPWIQSRSGAVSPDRRKTLGRDIAVSAKSFTLAAGQRRTVTLKELRRPSGGALFGSLEVIGAPTSRPRTSGIVAKYRLISSLRLTAARPRHGVRIGAARISRRNAVVAVRNSGNTVDAVAGRATLRSARGTIDATIAPVRVLPGATVDLVLTAASRLPKGRWTATVTLTQGGARVATARRAFTR
jgi:hypothetical protein